MAHSRSLPRPPEIGRPEHYYVQAAQEADRFHDPHARAAAKVGQYVTRAAMVCDAWEEKEKCYRHALKHYCFPPFGANDEVRTFYSTMAYLVREYAGQDVLKLASMQDDQYAERLRNGEPKGTIAVDASIFFRKLLPNDRQPEWLNRDDFEQLRILRDQWLGRG